MQSEETLEFKSRAAVKVLARRSQKSIGSGPDPSKIYRHPDIDTEDSLEDAAATGGNVTFNMNQSIFQMIAAGAKADYGYRFDASDSEDPDHDGQDDALRPPPNILRSVAMLPKSSTRKSFDRRMLQSTPHLRNPHRTLETHPEANDDEDGDSEGGAPTVSDTAGLATIDKRSKGFLEDQDRLLQSAIRESMNEHEAEVQEFEEEIQKNEADLAQKLMQIFGFAEPEDVLSEYPCWLLKSVLLQGYMYITTRHVCFYAYLPKRNHAVIKSGYLSKRGKSNPKYHRYWFVLKGDVLSYYEDSGNLYFPRGTIDLRYGVEALAEKDNTSFTIVTETRPSASGVTDTRSIHFKADSVPSAKEWAKALNKIIFQTHINGDSVKIVLPIDHITEVEESPVLEFGDTLKLEVLDSDDHSISPYFFSFFNYGKEALEKLRELTEDTALNRQRMGQFSKASSVSGATAVRDENVRSTLSVRSRPASPLPGSRSASPYREARCSPLLMRSPRSSGEYSRMEKKQDESTSHSFDSINSRHRNATRPFSGESFDSKGFTMSTTDSEAQASTDDESASQILSGSKIFQGPTLKKVGRRRKTETAEPSEKGRDRPTSIIIHQPSRSNTIIKDDLANPSEYPAGADSEGENVDNIRKVKQEKGKSGTRTPSLHDIVKAGTYPLQRAAGWADWMKSRSKVMGDLLSTPSMGYFEKVQDMWAGGRKQQPQTMGIMPEDHVDDDEDGVLSAEERFRERFALKTAEKLIATYYGSLNRVLPLYGKIYLGETHFCYRSSLPGTRTRMILPLKDVENVEKEKGFRFGYHGLVITIRGHEELFFEFGQQPARDDCWMRLLRGIDAVRHHQQSNYTTKEEEEGAEAAKQEYQALQEARHLAASDHNLQLPTTVSETSLTSESPNILFDDPTASLLVFKPAESLRITCLTIGSRGDVQPYIALCKGLLKEGHKPRIATHAEFRPWVESHGIEFATVEGDPAELMRICVENGMFTYSFLKEASSKFRGWIDELLVSAWEACQDSDILIESPSAMAGIHIAEALAIPYFRAFTMPWTRTRAYPHAFAVPEHKMGGAYNYFTYVMFDNVFWKAISGQVNRWRKTIGLPRTNLDKLQPNKVPFLYNFSPSVVVPPLDYSDWIRVTGYWFLEEQSNWEPPQDLLNFIRQARADGKKLVYVGFGSIVVADPEALTRTVIASVLKAGVRCILSKGWSDRLGSKNANEVEIEMPPEIHQIKSAPHDWLFAQIDAAAHHGGAGTTGASLRAGIPTIVKPFFGDQFFFGGRVEDLGVGVCIKKLNVPVFSKALKDATTDSRMIIKAKVLGEQIRKEDGVGTAIEAIYRDLEYARSLIKKPRPDGQMDEDSEEAWTHVNKEGLSGEDSDMDLMRRHET